MFLRALTVCLAAAVGGGAAAAPIDDLIDAMGLPEIVEIMRDEGVTQGETLARDMLPGGPDAAWRATVDRIYDPVRMTATVRDGMEQGLDDVDLAPLLAFFTSPSGRDLVQMEISARRAMVDPEVEDSARAAYRAAEAEDQGDDKAARLDLLGRFVEVNDLVEANVVGALNASIQFYNGLADGGALDLSEQDILTEVWQQEAETRDDTREWLFAFLMMAYGPLPEETVADYVALSSTDEGKALNRALFAGFNQMYDGISYALGLAVARDMAAQEL